MNYLIDKITVIIVLFEEEIFKKEKRYIKNGGKFITHVPIPRIV